MTLQEFKAWFEGYTEGLEATPTKAQFDRIKERVKMIDGTPMTYPIFVASPTRPLFPYWTPSWNIEDVHTVISAISGTHGTSLSDINTAYELGKMEATN